MTQDEAKKLYDSGEKNVVRYQVRSGDGRSIYVYGYKGSREIVDAMKAAAKSGVLLPIDG